MNVNQITACAKTFAVQAIKTIHISGQKSDSKILNSVIYFDEENSLIGRILLEKICFFKNKYSDYDGYFIGIEYSVFDKNEKLMYRNTPGFKIEKSIKLDFNTSLNLGENVNKLILRACTYIIIEVMIKELSEDDTEKLKNLLFMTKSKTIKESLSEIFICEKDNEKNDQLTKLVL